ncbi:glycosyltransferase family A protein [Algoriphagus sp. SE2]|uniref:glycosyltransferase family 2 protein n=1 Tax=Algoriphagus sp. SE2 TaxID=3141536 RepID=UPI0031CD03CC
MDFHFSIVIPLYNRANYISKAIKSVLNQSYQDFELIIVDDASTDESLQIVKAINDRRVRVVSLTENGGNAKARNAGWRVAKGEWIVYLDSDDWFEPNYLQNLSETIKANSDISFFWTGVRYVNPTGGIIKEEFWSQQSALPSTTFFDELRIGTNCGVAFKKRMLERFNGFDELFKASVDREIFLRISQKEKGGGISKTLVNCLIGDHESVRKDFIAQYDAYSRLIDRYHKLIELNNSRKKWWYHKAMWLALYCGKTNQARTYLKSMGYPLKSTLLYLIFILFPIGFAKKVHKRLATSL